jgi:hypothetical protein
MSAGGRPAEKGRRVAVAVEISVAVKIDAKGGKREPIRTPVPGSGQSRA